MATEWQHQVFVVCHSAAISGAISALNVAFPRDDGQPIDPGSPGRIGCYLLGPGGAYYGACFSVTEAIREHLEGLGLASVPGVTYWRCTNPGGILTTTNHAGSTALVGQPFTWEQAKAALGVTQQ